jgi:hypothetical protein
MTHSAEARRSERFRKRQPKTMTTIIRDVIQSWQIRAEAHRKPHSVESCPRWLGQLTMATFKRVPHPGEDSACTGV